MTIKAHCMGMEFPKRDTDSPKVDWVLNREIVAEVTGYHDFVAMNLNEVVFEPTHEDCERILRESAVPTLGRASDPSAADLDAVAEEQRVKEKTGG